MNSAIFRRFFLVSLSLVLTLSLCEIALRVTGLPRGVVAGWKALGHPESELNQFGFRGHQLEAGPDDFVVVLLGDSFVENVSSPIENIPERLLEKELKKLGLPAQVVSIGARGYGQDQQLLALREYFQENRADLVILWVIPENDVWNNMFRTHHGTPKPTFRLHGDQLVPPVWDWMERIDSPGLECAYRRLFKSDHHDDMWESMLPPSYAAQTEAPVADPNTLWQERWDEEPGFRDENFATDRNHSLLYLEPRSERISYGVKLTVRLLDAIQSLCQQHKTGFTLLYTGGTWEGQEYDRPLDDLAWYELNGQYYGHSSVRYWANMTELYKPFPLLFTPCTLEDWKVSETDHHLNQAANAQVMRDLAIKIVNQEQAAVSE